MRLGGRRGNHVVTDWRAAASRVTTADYLQTDDTTITVLDERGGSFKGRIWTYLDPLTHQVVFDATTTHERDGPAVFLANFRGKLQKDAYSGYDGLYQGGRMIEIGCWAHARRRFVEAFMTDPSAALMIALIQQLYQVEHEAAALDPEARRALRQEQALPLLAKIDAERQALGRTVLPKSPVGEAVRYLTNQWAALQRYVDDGRLAIDNNAADAASGISGGMPPARLCRASRATGRIERDLLTTGCC